MITDSNQRANIFLNGESEMTKLVNEKDWSQTPIGNINTWPASLKSLVGTMLENPFPTYLAWGKYHTQIYNDGYIPILGSLKHPTALGQSTQDTFSEHWEIVSGMFDQVLAGKPIIIKDGHYQLHRNGYLEDCYFDFAYSPIRIEDGTIEGVLVTVMETTNQKKAIDSLTESESRFKLMAENSDILIALSDESGKALFFNKAWEELTGKKTEDLNNTRMLKLLHADQLKEFTSNIKTAISTHESWSGEYQFLNRTGEYSWLLVRGAARFNLDQSFAGHVISAMDITQRKFSEQKLRDSEKLMKSIIEASPFPISVLFGDDLKVEFANEAIIAAWGKGDDVIGKNFKNVLPELANQGVFEQLEGVRESGLPSLSKPQRVEMNMHGKKEVKYYNISFNPIKNESEQIIGIFNSGVDVTDLVLSKQKIEEAEAKARLAIDSAEQGVYEFTYATSEFITDRRFHEICGFDNPISLERYRNLIHPDDIPTRAEAHKRSFDTGRVNYQVRIVIGDGSIRWVRVTGRIIYISDQIPVKLTGIIQDITLMILAQQKIEESERTIRNMVLQAPVAMCILRGNDYIVEIANKKMIELWGLKDDKIIGKAIFEGIPEARAQGLEELLEGVASTGNRFVANERPILLPRDGKLEQVYLNFVYEPIGQKTGDKADIMAIAIDVTPQVRARKEIEVVIKERTDDLAKAITDLRRSNEDLAQFAYIASHDLQEPIRKITSFSEMLQNHLGNQLDDLSVTFLEKIINASTRMSKLVRDVLTYSETGKKSEEFIPVNLNKILKDVVTDFDLLIEQKEATIILDELPEIEGIPLQMTQLFGNLISNALKFSSKTNSPLIEIKVGKADMTETILVPLYRDIPYIHIQIRDNGIGFLPAYGEQIFNIFQRLHRKTDFAGTGIGLSMCKKIVQNHQGEINSKGSSESGAVFNIFLPYRQSSND